MSRIKIGYFADGPWSHKTFKLLEEDDTIEVSFIVPRTDTQDNTLEKYSNEYAVDYLHPVNINSDTFFTKAEEYDCDLFVSMSFNQIFKKQIMNLPKYGTINCHAGKLPFYRGRNVLNWALINDEDEFGITVHFIDEGIDTGDIILQETFPITEEDDYGSLLNVAYKECANLLYKAIKRIQHENYERTKQDDIHPVGMYCGRRTIGDEIIDWNTNSRELFNFIRALAYPGPKATTFLNGKTVKINKARVVEKAPTYKNISGQVLKKTNGGFLVKTKDSFIEIFEIETDVNIKVSNRFGDGKL